MAAIAADRDLLFGLLALQNGLIDQVQLVAAFQAWTRDKLRPLAEHLVGRGDLDAEQRSGVEAMVALHLKKQGGDVEKSLAAVPASRAALVKLAAINEPQIEATLARIGSARAQNSHATEPDDGDPDRTAGYSLGASTSDGERFRVLRPHARGGLGAVFVALDNELNREVALKQILEQHADDPFSRQRFVAEAEITGSLEHPGVVPVYGLGTHTDGRPYYAMRLIRGESLKEAIDRFHGPEASRGDPGRRSLELRKLLRRFLDVCNAIDYAHSRGVLHRDLKPANVVLGKHGETLVVDWGLAKSVGRADPSIGEQTIAPSSSGSSETLPGSALGTPAYMSPEQARGELERLGPRSDVYSLGATLYCLLCGKPPFEGEDVGAILRAVQDGGFDRPTQRDASIDRALEAVCLKAMATRPEDRYNSCRAMADDIERWMADEPVSAWKEPPTRALLRWLTRHRTGVTGLGAAVLAGMVGLSAVLAVQTRANADLKAANADLRAANARAADANAELTRSRAAVQGRYDLAVEAIKTFHTGVSEDFLLKEEKFKALRDRLLKSASDFYGKLSALLGKETDLASRRALAASNFELARLTARVGRKEDALSAHRSVLAAREALAAEPGAEADVKTDIGESLIALAGLLWETGKAEEAVSTYRRAEGLLADLAAPESAAGPVRASLAAYRSALGSALSGIGQRAEGLELLRQARSDQEALATAAGSAKEARGNLADTIMRIAGLLEDTNKKSETEAEYRQALTIRQKLAAENQSVADFRAKLANSHTALGAFLYNAGKRQQGEAELRAAMAIWKKLTDENPAVTEFSSSLALGHFNRGVLLSIGGNSAEAEFEFRAALAIRQKLADENPSVTRFREMLAQSYDSISSILSNAGKLAQAEAFLRDALSIRQKLAEQNPAVADFASNLAASHLDLGQHLFYGGRPEEGEAELRAALALQQRLADDHSSIISYRRDLAQSYQMLGMSIAHDGRLAEAETEYRKALAIYQKLVEDNPKIPDLSRALSGTRNNLAVLLWWMGRPAEAETEARQALAIQRKVYETDPKFRPARFGLANRLHTTAEVVRSRGRASEARELQDEGIVISERLVEEDPTDSMRRRYLAQQLRRRAMSRRDLGDLAGAGAELRRALQGFDSLPSRHGEACFETACCHAALAGMAGRSGSGTSAAHASSEADAAMAMLREAVETGFRNAFAFRIEDALDPLRGRTDFQLLMMDLSFPSEPFAAAR
jgi:serine/threonine-protein kinase